VPKLSNISYMSVYVILLLQDGGGSNYIDHITVDPRRKELLEARFVNDKVQFVTFILFNFLYFHICYFYIFIKIKIP